MFKKAFKFIGYSFLVIFALAAIGGAINGFKESSKTPEQKVADVQQAEKNAESQKKQDEADKRQQLAIIGVLFKTVDTLRDPQSLQIISLTVVDQKEVLAGCMKFRSRNGFGGMTNGISVWYISGKKFYFRAQNVTDGTLEDPSAWNTYCVRPSHDKTELGQNLLEKMRANL